MKIFFSKLFMHILLLLLTLFFFEQYLDKIDVYKYYKYSYNDIFNIVKKDNIIIGASHATHGINPKYLSFGEFYNFALNGASPSFTLIWYKDIFIKNYKNPKLIIYEVNGYIFNSKILWRRIEQDSRYLPYSLIVDLLSDNKINKLHLLRNKFIVLGGGVLYKKFAPTNIVDDNTIYNGFVALTYNNLVEFDKIKYEIDLSQIHDFITLIRLIKENKSNIVFVQTPEYIPYCDSLNMQYNNMVLKDIAKTYNIPFINYNDENISEINHNKNLYIDREHLNKEGSIQFSKLLDKDLITILTK